VALDLNFLEVGFGNLSAGHGFGTLKTSDSRIGIGLWHFDPLIKSNVLMSWIGSEFRTVTVWLPSFAAAIVECWPSTIDDRLHSWFQLCNRCRRMGLEFI
jgi:hypothetical protein